MLFSDQPEITAHPQNVEVREGNNVTLSCNATGNPEPTISWTKDGSPINSNSRNSFSADNKQLTITNVNRTDSGEYRCVASNSVGKKTSNAATVDVKCKYIVNCSQFLDDQLINSHYCLQDTLPSILG